MGDDHQLSPVARVQLHEDPADVGLRRGRNTHGSGATPSFSPWLGLALLAGYAATALGIGGWHMMRRDA